MDIKSIFSGINLAKEIAGYLGLYETLGIKVEKLLRSELHSGINALEQAINSNSETESLFREARSAFNKATALEKNERLILANLGLALCHKNLKDEKNFVITLSNIKHINFEGQNAETVKSTIDKTIKTRSPFPITSIPASLIFNGFQAKNETDLRVINFNKLKTEIQSFLDSY